MVRDRFLARLIDLVLIDNFDKMLEVLEHSLYAFI